MHTRHTIQVREGKTCGGTLTFQGQLDQPNRGNVVFAGNPCPHDSGATHFHSKLPPS